MKSIKYPKIPHLPYSLSMTSDDRTLESDSHFLNQEVIVLEKMDGENTTLYKNNIHARSINGYSYHKSRFIMKTIHAWISYLMPENERICGENVYAKHSIYYDNLESYFYVFAISNKVNGELIYLTYDQIVKKVDYYNTKLEMFKMAIPTLLYRGIYNREKIINNFEKLSKIKEVEGFVITLDKNYNHSEFRNNIAKFVRKNHVQTDEHWLNKPIIENKLRRK